ncbi:hypothetical protein HPB48_012924 [Haemaphysalis longicornis]|uniref:Kinase n=1 Tax=Haemaphysalis longicornis TaxID=44386 RepID=A0A9J6GKR3_HAELO|nr:hypothetical protein HPB48_012924 [Haemaphysalis longicornis]
MALGSCPLGMAEGAPRCPLVTLCTDLQEIQVPWIQLAGHQGNFRSGAQGTILKKLCGKEESCLKQLMRDPWLRDYVPEFKGRVEMEDCSSYLELQDLLAGFQCPCVMDVKIGLRTYLEEELAKARERSPSSARSDMYEKMVAVDPDEPTPEEHELKAVTKPRYMIWRETISSTASLGFRIEGIKGKYLQRLRSLYNSLEQSEFFSTHELPLLFVHDRAGASVWLIDFAKTVSVPPGVNITHRQPWEVGNHEDGYLIGLSNLIGIFEELLDNRCGGYFQEPAPRDHRLGYPSQQGRVSRVEAAVPASRGVDFPSKPRRNLVTVFSSAGWGHFRRCKRTRVTRVCPPLPGLIRAQPCVSTARRLV